MTGLPSRLSAAQTAASSASIPDISEAYEPDAAPVPLGTLNRGASGSVVRIVDGGENLGDEAQSTLAQRLLDIGFVCGERCEVISQTWPGGDPMAVRIGNSVFALRRREASAVLVRLDRAVQPIP